MRIFLLSIIVLSIHLTSCRNEASLNSSQTESSNENAIVDKYENSNWALVKRFKFEDDCRPYGIANFKNYLAISDSSNDRIVLFDTLDHSILVDLELEDPGFIKVKKSTLVVPSASKDSIYYFKGEGLIKLKNFAPMKNPSSVDVERVDHWAFVDKGNNRVLFQNGPKDIQIIFGQQNDSNYKFKDPTNVLMLDSLICIVDTGNKRVQVFTETGNFYSSITNGSNWISPTGISNEEDTLYISDPIANRIDLFTVQGEYLETIQEHLKGPTDINYYEYKLFIANNSDSTITVLKELN